MFTGDRDEYLVLLVSDCDKLDAFVHKYYMSSF